MKERFFVEVLRSLSKESKCVSRQVSCVLVKDNRIISTGYNGTLSGASHCNDKFDKDSFDKHDHHIWSRENEVHAEQNAIAFAARNGITTQGAICYTSLQPCNTCLLILVQSGITEIVYLEDYEKSNFSESLSNTLQSLNVKIRKYIE